MILSLEPIESNIKQLKIKKSRWVIALLLIFIGSATFFAALWVLRNFNFINLNMMLFQLSMGTEGANNYYVINVLLSSLLPALAIVLAFRLLFGKRIQKDIIFNFKFKKKPRKIKIFSTGPVRRHIVRAAAVCFTLFIVISLGMMDVFGAVAYNLTRSSFIDSFYIDPEATPLSFPKEKKNLIYIYLESMENTFMSKKDGGAMAIDIIPELTALTKQPGNVSFSNTAKAGGAYQIENASWTIASTVAQSAGLPLLIPTAKRSQEILYSSFLPGAWTLGDILKEQGYNQSYLIGSHAAFGGRGSYFKQHGDFSVKDLSSARKDKLLPSPDYDNGFWGMEDHYLYEYAKREITSLAKSNQPFNLTMLTVDTHFPSGYRCAYCDEEGLYRGLGHEEYENDLIYSVRCASRQVNDFINWLRTQSFFEDTVIVITGDHLNMAKDYFEQFGDYERTIYNCIINAQAVPENNKNRRFTALDMYPTTLAALGIKINGEALGLGVNLFSKKSTLAEEKGLELLDKELSKRSRYFDDYILMDGK